MCRRSSRVLAAAVLAATAFITAPAAASPVAISAQERTWELQVGQEEYAKYAQRGEIVPRQSRLYGILDPVANAVAAVASHYYYAAFHFILLNETEPNAFSMPGGNVYVTTAMLSYLRNRDELAGVLCHEVNHDIHHDMYNVNQAVERGAQPIAYERAAEMNADRAGAYTCAKAGFNPWGMVWNMRLRHGMGQAQQMSPTDDHPSDDQRLAALTVLLRSDPAAFGKFRDDAALSLTLPNTRPFVQTSYSRGTQGSYPTQYQGQYPTQYQGQYPTQYQGQYPTQYRGQYPTQYQGQYPGQYPSPYQQAEPYPPPPPPLPACYPGC